MPKNKLDKFHEITNQLLTGNQNTFLFFCELLAQLQGVKLEIIAKGKNPKDLNIFLEKVTLLKNSLEQENKILDEISKDSKSWQSYIKQKVNSSCKRITSINFIDRLLHVAIKLIPSFLKPTLGTLIQHDPKRLIIPNYYKLSPTPKKPPKISIVTPSYNQGSYIKDTIKSVLNQNYDNLEYIIQDGKSTDNTLEILQKYKKLLHWNSAKDRGQGHAINLGFRKTSGEIMAYLNSDDLLLPGTLNYIANYFQLHPEVDVVYGHRIIINEKGSEIGRWVLPPHNNEVLSWADYIPQETLFWRRKIWNKTGGAIDESFKFALDWDLLTRFRKAGAKFHRLPRFLGAFRVHQNQKTSSEIGKIGLEEMTRIRLQCHKKYVTNKQIFKHISIYLIKNVFFTSLFKLGIFKY